MKKREKLHENCSFLGKNCEQNVKITDFRFKINPKKLGKKHKEIIELDKELYHKIKFNKSPLISVHRGYDILMENIIEYCSEVECVYEDFFRSYWYVNSISIGYIYDVVSVSGSPDYVGFDDLSGTRSCELLLAMFKQYSIDQLGMTRISDRKYACVVNWFVHYVLKCRDNNVIAIKYSRDESFRSLYGVNNSNFSYSVLIRFIDYLVSVGLVINFIGNKLHGCSVSSMLIVSNKVFDIIGDDQVITTTYNQGNSQLLKVTDDNGKLIEKSDIKNIEYYNRMLIDTVPILEKYHRFMDENKIEINGYDLGGVRLHRVIKDHEGVSSRWFDDGGFQGKPKDVRKDLTFMGEKTVSLDFKSLHPAILLYYEGIRLCDHNPYPELKGVKLDLKTMNRFITYYDLPNYNPVRNLIKKLFLAMINADNINNAVGAIYEDMSKDNLKKGTYREHTMKYVGIGNVDLHKVAKVILKHNKCIAKYLGTGVGRRLQYVDSNIIKICLDELTDLKIPCIPVHDSISCKEKDKDVVKQVMTKAFISVVGEGSEFNCVIEEE